jgi:hypothetical protein
MKKLLLSTFFCFSLFSFQAFSQSNSRLNLGTPENLLNSIRNQRSNTPASYSLQLATGAIAEITIENYSDQASGFSMNGIAKESANSLFILKGDRTSLYGYLVLHDSKKAYGISTNDGVVSLQEINIAAIYPDLYETEMKAPAKSLAPLAVAPVYSKMAKRQVIHIGPYNNEDVTKLQSKPGSPYVFYLNHSAVMNGTTPKNSRTKEEMYRVWQCTADQYSMFNLNVTTDPAVYNAAKSADVLKTGNITFVDQDGRSNACVACFGTTAAGTLYRDPSNNDYGYGIGMTCAHEMGHQMGMSHDGGSAQTDPEYFYGLPAVQWCPIMGNYWYGGNWANQLFTWSKGEYNTATQTQDDLKIMNVNEKVPYMVDDNVSGKKLKIGSAGTIGSSDNWGQIEKNTDTDEFTFEVGEAGGKINLRIDPIEYLRQLDIAAKIVDASGTAVSTSNLAVNRSAEFKDLSLKAGKYTLVIQGGAELTPQTGFSTYSSLGYYAMEGTLTGAIITSVGDVAFENKVAVFPNPTADLLNISYGFNNQNTQVTLIDVTGQTVYQSNQLVQSIDLSSFSKGIYFLRITLGQESCVKKVSKL